MSARRFEAAEGSFAAGLESLEDKAPDDLRTHVILGHLVTLASVYERLGRGEDAQRVLMSISARELGPHPRRGNALTYEERYRTLIQEALPLAFKPPPAVESSLRAVNNSPQHRLDVLITRTAAQYQVDRALVKAVVAAESNFDVDAVSSAGALGLMQLMPATAEEMGVRSPFRPSDNIAGGVRYLRSMLDRYGDVSHALAAYNAGPSAVDRYGSVPPYPETEAYVRRVLRYYQEFQERFSN